MGWGDDSLTTAKVLQVPKLRVDKHGRGSSPKLKIGSSWPAHISRSNLIQRLQTYEFSKNYNNCNCCIKFERLIWAGQEDSHPNLRRGSSSDKHVASVGMLKTFRLPIRWIEIQQVAATKNENEDAYIAKPARSFTQPVLTLD